MRKGMFKVILNSLDLHEAKIDHGHSFTIQLSAGGCTSLKSFTSPSYLDLSTCFLPLADRMEIKVGISSEHLEGYFNLPLIKFYEYPIKKHLVSIGLVGRNKETGKVEKEGFGEMKITVIYLEGVTAKFEVFVKKVIFEKQGSGHINNDVHVECHIGTTTSQTTVKKPATEDSTMYKINELLPFTLEDIPPSIVFIIKNTENVLGKVQVDPQANNLFVNGAKVQKSYSIDNHESKIQIQTHFSVDHQ